MSRKVLLDKNDYDQYVIPFPGKMRGKAVKAYVLQEMEKRHPCFMNRCIWTSGRNDGQSLLVTVIDREVLKANYAAKHGSLWIESPETGKKLRFRGEKETARKRITAGIVFLVFIFLAGLLLFVMNSRSGDQLPEVGEIMIEVVECESAELDGDGYEMDGSEDEAAESVTVASDAVETGAMGAMMDEIILNDAIENDDRNEKVSVQIEDPVNEAITMEIETVAMPEKTAVTTFLENDDESWTEEFIADEQAGSDRSNSGNFVFPGEIIQDLIEKGCRILSVGWEFFPLDTFADNLVFYFNFSGFYPEQLYEIAEKWSSLPEQHFYVESVWYESGTPECRCVFMTQATFFDHEKVRDESQRLSALISPLAETRTAFVKNGGIPVSENIDECSFSGLIEGKKWPDFCGALQLLSHKGILPEEASFSASDNAEFVSVSLKMRETSQFSFPLESADSIFSFSDPDSSVSENSEPEEEKVSLPVPKSVKEIGRIRSNQGIMVYYHDEKGHLKSFLLEEN